MCEMTVAYRSSEEDSKRGETKRQLVELEREIGLTTPLIAELDSRLTGLSGTAKPVQSPTALSGTSKPIQSPTQVPAERASSAELTVKAKEAASISSVTVEKQQTTAVDSGLQMASPTSSSRSFQVCIEFALILPIKSTSTV